MKKQFLAITLLLSCVQVSKPMSVDRTGLALLAAGVAASHAGNAYYRTDKNRSSLATRVGSCVGIEGAGVAKLTAAGLLMGGLARLFPDTSVPLATAAGLGATVLTVRAALGGHDQAQNPLNVNNVMKWTIIGAAAGTCYNQVPFVNNLVNGALGR